jgi:hypothetical protein
MHDVYQELLGLDHQGANVIASLPPSVGIERRIARRTNHNLREMARQGTMKHSTDPARMIRAADHDDGVEIMLLAPVGDHLSLGIGAPGRRRNSFNLRHAKPAQQLNQIRPPVLEWNAPVSQFPFSRLRRLCQNRHSPGHSAVHQVSSINCGSSASPLGHHDDVGLFNWLVDHQRPANTPQDRIPDEGYTNKQADQHDNRQDWEPAPPTAHAVMIRRIINAGLQRSCCFHFSHSPATRGLEISSGPDTCIVRHDSSALEISR